MAYRFEPDESVRRAIFRCGHEQLDHAIAELSEGTDKDPARAIHSARKAFKKERSLLRLARGAMPGGQRKRENAALREAARSVSGARDAEVMVASVDDLSERFAGQLPATAFERVREHLEARRSPESDDGSSSAAATRAVRELEGVRGRVDDWQLQDRDWAALESGLLRTYRRGRKAFAQARASGEMEDLHAWRKRVKDLWYHERLLAPTCGPTVRGHAKDLERLSDLLGDDHDLGLLSLELTQGGTPRAVDSDAVVKLIEPRRAELLPEAVGVGERVYAETPKAFRRRMRAGWEAGRALARAPQDQHPAQLAAATR